MSFNRKTIYADNAATSKLDPLALEAMLPFLREDFGNPSSLHSFGRSPRSILNESRQQIAECIGASPEEIFFTSGGTESNNWALKGLAKANTNNKKHIITSAIEHHAVLNTCSHLEHQGFEVTYIPVDSKGHISKVDLENAIRQDTICISIMLASNEIGTIEDIATISSISNKYNIPFHTDAVQAVGHIPVDIKKLGVDLLSASAHKFNGPKGVGFLFVRKGTTLFNFMDGGYQENGCRAGTENIPGIVGMTVALRNNYKNIQANTEKINNLTFLFKKYISQAITPVKFNGDQCSSLPGNVSVSIPGISGESLLHYLDLKGIAVSTGSACNSQSVEISHVLKAIKLSETLANGTIRISFGKNNFENDPIIIAEEIISYCKKINKVNMK